MIYTILLKEVTRHKVQIEAPADTAEAVLYNAARQQIGTTTAVNTKIVEDSIQSGDTLAALKEELTLWCNNRGLTLATPETLLLTPNLDPLEIEYLQLLVRRRAARA